MKISDLKIGQKGYYSDGYYSHPKSVKFVKAIIDGEEYVACWHDRKFEIKRKKEDFFDTFSIFCDSENSEYNKNYECFLTEREVLDYNHNQIINRKLRELEEKKKSLLDIKYKLLMTEKQLAEIDFEKQELELKKKLK